MFRTLSSEVSIGITWPSAGLAMASYFSDALEYRSYLRNTVQFYRAIFRDPVAGLLGKLIDTDIPPLWVDYAVACSVCFAILNWSRRKISGRDHVATLLSSWMMYLRYIAGFIPFRKVERNSPVPVWLELPVMTFLTFMVTLSFPLIYLLSPALLVGLIIVGVADLIPRRPSRLLPQLYLQIVNMKNMVERPEKWSKFDEWRKQDLIRRLKKKMATVNVSNAAEGARPPKFRSHWDIEDFFGTRNAIGITKNIDIAVQIQREKLRDGALQALRSTAFFAFSFFAIIAASLKF